MLTVPIGLALSANASVAAGREAGSDGTTERRAAPAVSLDPVRVLGSRAADVLSTETVVGDQTAPGRFKGPRGLALGPEGTIYVVEGGNHRLQQHQRATTLRAGWLGRG